MSDQSADPPASHETLDEIDAAVDEIPDGEIAARLNALLAHVAGLRVSDADHTAPSEDAVLVRWKAEHAVELENLIETLEATRRELRIVQSEVIAARARRDDLNRAANLADLRLVQARRQLAETTPDTAAFLDAVSTRSREVLENAHNTAQKIVNDAHAQADGILGRARFRAEFVNR
ncbi:hypothetical protein [Actinoplanes aureus]|uniref:Uncharacterized protein n=1 Tax=Actinoplanes aureus TaxID=2792083 RepID=A0A931CIJ7_9ACTN|nr:hypothetical protein [Actinoplanes aureus]MBG0569239.1 hypothetical protein [Actinoplanes aureus]